MLGAAAAVHMLPRMPQATVLGWVLIGVLVLGRLLPAGWQRWRYVVWAGFLMFVFTVCRVELRLADQLAPGNEDMCPG